MPGALPATRNRNIVSFAVISSRAIACTREALPVTSNRKMPLFGPVASLDNIDLSTVPPYLLC